MRPGGTLEFEGHGPAASSWLLFASFAQGEVETVFGTALLDLTSLIPAGAGLLSSDGVQSLAFQVSAIPALLGVPLFWQGLVGAPFRLTNRETSVFTNL